MSEFAEVLAVDVIAFSQKSGCVFQFEQIYRAIEKLSALPPEKGVKFHRKGLQKMVASKKAHVYARTFKIPIITRNSGEYMMIARRPHYTQNGEMEVRLLAQECKSNRKDPVQPSNNARSNQQGPRSCASALINKRDGANDQFQIQASSATAEIRSKRRVSSKAGSHTSDSAPLRKNEIKWGLSRSAHAEIRNKENAAPAGRLSPLPANTSREMR